MAKKNLLLVDSDAKALRMLEVSLRKSGFSVTTAISSADAVEKIRVAAPDLILTETRLPDESGLAFVGRLKERPETARIPIVFLSSENIIDQKVKGLELGVEDYLTKPIYLKEVLTRIRILLEKLERETLERRERSATFAGLLGEMGLVDLIQTIEMGRKTGRIFLDNPPHKGSVAFREGKVVDSRTGRLKGERAFYRMLVWNEGVFQMEFGPHDEQDVIELSTQGLLMEGMRRVDEWGRLLEQLPPLEHAFEIDYGELVNRLAEIPDEVNGVLRLFDGRRALLDVVDESDFGDLEALEVVSKLYFEGLIFDVGDRREGDAAPGAPAGDAADGEPGAGVARIEQWLDGEGGGETSDVTAPPEPAPPSTTTPPQGFTLAPPKGETQPPRALRTDETSPPSYLTDSTPPTPNEEWDDVVASEEVIRTIARADATAASAHDDGLGDALADELGLSADEVALAVSDEARDEPPADLFTPVEPEEDVPLARALDASMQSFDTDVEGAASAVPASAIGRVKPAAPMQNGAHAEAASPTSKTDLARAEKAPDASASRDDEGARAVALPSPDAVTTPERPAKASEAPTPSAVSSSTTASAPPQKAAVPAPAADDLDDMDRAFRQRAETGARAMNDSIPPIDDDEPPARSSFATAALFIGLLVIGFLGAVGVTRALRTGDEGETPVVAAPTDTPNVALTTPTLPTGTEPSVDEPGARRDAGVAAAATDPVVAPPTDTPPVVTQPVDKPLDTKPSDSKPVDTKPSDTKPSDTKPLDTKASDSKPLDTKPIDTKPSDTKPSDTKASDNKPSDTKPSDSRPDASSSDEAFASHLKKATGFAQKGEHSKSIRSFKAALALKGESAAAHLGLGNAYYELNSIDAALVHLERARALSPDDPQVYVLLGAVYQSAGRTKEAIRAYQRYLELAPNGRFARELKNVLQGLEAQP